jgi:hypothetical protein
MLQTLMTNRIWIALAAMGLTLETSVFHQIHHSIFFYGFIFSSTWFAYLFYYTQQIGQFRNHVLLILSLLLTITCGILIHREIHWLMLCSISALSLVYLLPIAYKLKLIPFQLHLSHSTKLFLLASVWWTTTYLLPLEHIPSSPFEIQFGLYRSLMISILCLLFYIRDEENLQWQQIGKWLLYFLLCLQLGLSLFKFYQTSNPIWILGFGLHILLFFISYFFLTRQQTLLQYLFWIDGFMILHASASLTVYLQTNT